MVRIEIKAISIDFWNTLYFHAGSADYRKKIRSLALRETLSALGYQESEGISKEFFPVVDGFIKGSWKENRCPRPEQVFQHAYDHFSGKIPAEDIQLLFKRIQSLYQEELRPRIAQRGIETISWLAERWPVFLISNTYTVSGATLEAVMQGDGVAEKFRHLYFSDQVGFQKPDTYAIGQITSSQGIEASSIVHIGDDLAMDGGLAERSGCQCIIVGCKDLKEEQQRRPGQSSSFFFCEDFSAVTGILEAFR